MNELLGNFKPLSQHNFHPTYSTTMSGVPAEKRSNHEEQESGPKRTCLPVEELSLNTNISVMNSLDWPIAKAVRELLLNCLDEDPAPNVTQTVDGQWLFVNKIREGRLGLTAKSFEYGANLEKQANRIASGKFGYGMKDAIAILLAHKITFMARCPHATYTARVRDGGEIYIAVDNSQIYEDGVQQVISCGPGCKLSRQELATAVAAAKNDCLPFCVSDLRHLSVMEVVDPGTQNILGTVYYSSNPDIQAAGHTDIFVHNLRYPFAGGASKRLPLYFLYNLNMDKKALRSRDRNELPKAWNTCMSNLLKVSIPLCDKLASQMPLNQQFYEFGHNHILGYVNDATEAVRTALEEKQQEKKLAEEELKRREKDVARFQARSLELKAAVIEGGVSAHRLRSTAENEKKLEKALTLVAAQQQTVDSLPKGDVYIKPVVCVLKGGTGGSIASNIDSSKVCVTVATSASSKTYLRYPTDEEFDLMTKASIPDSARHIFRELRRLLYVLNEQNNVSIVQQPGETTGVNNAVFFSAGSLHVNFEKPKEDVLRSAVVALSSSGAFTALKGMSAPEAVSALCVSILKHTPTDTREIVRINGANTDTHMSVVTSVDPVFCPLLVATEWDSSEGGISTFNMQLARGLVAEMKDKNTSVYVLVLSPVKPDRRQKVDAEWQSALLEGIVVVDASHYRGEWTPMLNPTQCASITHVIGHAHITGAEAKQVSTLPQLRHTKLWQINHVMPRTVDIIKEDGTQQQREESARTKDTVIQKLNDAADFVWSVGQEMFEHFDRHIPSEKHSQLILPLHPDFLAEPTPLKDFKSLVKVLYFGRTENVFFVKGMDIAAHACAAAARKLRDLKIQKRIELQVRGTPAGSEAETAQRLKISEHSDAHVTVDGFASPEQVRKDLQSAGLVIMPSRMEPFGLVATEAIACGVPVLVTRNSGVALLLQQHRGTKYSVETSRYRPDDDQIAFRKDVEKWSDAIVSLIQDGADAFKNAADLRDRMVKDMVPPYADMVARGTKDL